MSFLEFFRSLCHSGRFCYSLFLRCALLLRSGFLHERVRLLERMCVAALGTMFVHASRARVETAATHHLVAIHTGRRSHPSHRTAASRAPFVVVRSLDGRGGHLGMWSAQRSLGVTYRGKVAGDYEQVHRSILRLRHDLFSLVLRVGAGALAAVEMRASETRLHARVAEATRASVAVATDIRVNRATAVAAPSGLAGYTARGRHRANSQKIGLYDI